MEDFILCQKVDGINPGDKDDLFGVFDGHGGYLVSLFSKTVLPDVLNYNMN